MNWYEITVTTNKTDMDIVSTILLDQGCGGVLVEDPEEVRDRLENPMPLDYVGADLVEHIPDAYVVKAYFSIDSDIDCIAVEVCKQIKACCRMDNELFIKLVDDEDWNSWKEYFKPFSLVDGITVVPSWETYVAAPGEKLIFMDPGMAFGTGTHETTRLCARLVNRYVKENDYFLDLGTGTGILSMVASLKKPGRIMAVDVDDAAVRAAKENFGANGIPFLEGNVPGEGVRVVKGTLESVNGNRFHVVAANIIAEVLMDMAPDLPKVMANGGMVLLSGIITEKESQVMTCYQEAGFQFVGAEYENDWVAMVFQWQDSM